MSDEGRSERSEKTLTDSDIESIVDERVNAKLTELEADTSKSSLSRRSVLGLLGGGAIGVGLLGATTNTADAQSLELSDSTLTIGSISAEEITADSISATSSLTLNGESVGTGGTDGTTSGSTGLGFEDLNVRIADNAGEIQQYIDELNGAQSGQNGGVIMLKANKTYYPKETIVLKKGVHLVGQNHIFNGDRGTNYINSVISARDLPAAGDGVGQGGGHFLIRTQSKPNDDAGDATSIKNIYLDGEGRDDVHGIGWLNVSSPILEGSHVKNFGGHAMYLDGAFDYVIHHTQIDGGTLKEHNSVFDFDTYGIRTTSKHENTQSRNCQGLINASISSSGVGGGQPTGSTAIFDNSAVMKLYSSGGYRCHVQSRNTVTDRTFPVVHKTTFGGPLRLLGVNITGYNDGTNIIGVKAEADVVAQECTFQKYGVNFQQAQKGTASTIIGCEFFKPDKHNIEVLGSGHLPRIIACDIIEAGHAIQGDGIHIEGNVQNTIRDTSITASSGYALYSAKRGGDVVQGSGIQIHRNERQINDPSAFAIDTVDSTYKNSERDTETISGNGRTKRFTISHSMDEVPSHVEVVPDSSTDAELVVGTENYTEDSFDVVFTRAPKSGRNNVTIRYRAFGESAK